MRVGRTMLALRRPSSSTPGGWEGLCIFTAGAAGGIMAEKGSECWQYPLLEGCRCSCSKWKSLSRKWLRIKKNAKRRLWRPNDTWTGPLVQTFWSSCTFQNVVSPEPTRIMLLGFGIGALSSKTNTITNLQTNIHRVCKNNSNTWISFSAFGTKKNKSVSS